jgi:hypothetical protein
MVPGAGLKARACGAVRVNSGYVVSSVQIGVHAGVFIYDSQVILLSF